MAEKFSTTPSSDWTVPNQAALELVIDARLALHAATEVSNAKRPAVENKSVSAPATPATTLSGTPKTETPKS